MVFGSERVIRARLESALAVAGLCGLALVQPTLAVFGDNAEFFVASKMSSAAIATFAVVVALGPTLLVGSVDFVAGSVDDRLGIVVHWVLMTGLGAVFALRVLRYVDLPYDLVVLAIALLTGWLIARAETRVPAVSTGLRYLALAPIAFLAIFLLVSPASRLIIDSEASVEQDVTVADPAPVVLLTLDELPTASLLRPDGSLNDARFPNFARLAAGSTWYRNANSPSANTELAVPAILTGRNPKLDLLPTSGDHPRSLFTLLGSVYEERVQEWITQLCPTSICRGSEFDDPTPVSRLASDAAVVFGHTVLPSGLRAHLPPVDNKWARFGEVGSDEAGRPRPSDQNGDDSTDDGSDVDDVDLAGTQRVWDLESSIARLEGMDAETLWFTHTLLPHSPWQIDPNGDVYPRFGPNPEGIALDAGWRGEVPIRQGLQRHLLQLVYVDGAIGRLIDGLEEQGIWDDAFVAVVADHGAAFTEGFDARTSYPETAAEIYHVPMFLKLPGQEEGRVSDANVSTIDVMPTLVDALGVNTGWEFDGTSLVEGDGGRGDTMEPADYAYGSRPVRFDDVVAVARRNHDLLPGPDDVRGIYEAGELGHLVNTPVDRLRIVGTRPGSWQLSPDLRDLSADPEALDLVPAGVDGSFSPESGLGTGQEALIVVNDIVAGVAEVYEQGDGASEFTAVLHPGIVEASGTNVVEILVPVEGSDSRAFRRLAPAEDPSDCSMGASCVPHLISGTRRYRPGSSPTSTNPSRNAARSRRAIVGDRWPTSPRPASPTSSTVRTIRGSASS